MLAWFLATAAAGFAGIYLFIALVDPWGVLPLSPPLPRVPITSNARFSMPALARSAKFDSAVFGSSSSRLLEPAQLDAAFGGHFANLAMNAATAWEQSELLGVFTRAHPDARTVIIGLDTAWCSEAPPRLTGRPFPEWMYRGSPWLRYFHIANVFALQEAVKEFAVLIGIKRPPYGLDGYTVFVPDEREYNTARVAAAFVRWGAVPYIPGVERVHDLPALPMLASGLRALPAATRKIVFFTPGHINQQGAPGSDYAAMLAACKAQVSAIAKSVPGTAVIDFMLPSPITSTTESYWDPVHYRVPIAERLVDDLVALLAGNATSDARRLM
jgi:hypothetical protein